MDRIKKILDNWLYVDTRNLALFRIVFGIMGLCDVIRRIPVIDVFYSNEGMDFRRNVTSKYSIKYFSLLDHFHNSIEVHIFFIITAVCFILFIIGYRTRFFHFLSAIGLISIHNAAVIVENGGDMVFNTFIIWTLFLPLGISWSIDSIRKSLHRYPEENSSQLNSPLNNHHKRIFHFAYFACLVQLSMIYFYNTITHRSGLLYNKSSLFLSLDIYIYI